MSDWKRWLPGLQTLRRYEAAWLPHDLVAGLVLTTMLVPVGIAYAVASGVPGIYGLYATIVPLLAYACSAQPHPRAGAGFFSRRGDSRGCAAAFCRRSGAGRSRGQHDGGGVGAGVHPVGVMRLGFVTELLSKPIRYGYMNGIALTVLISQLPKLFGFSIETDGPLRDLLRIAGSVLGGEANWTAFVVGAGTLAVILPLKPSSASPAS